MGAGAPAAHELPARGGDGADDAAPPPTQPGGAVEPADPGARQPGRSAGAQSRHPALQGEPHFRPVWALTLSWGGDSGFGSVYHARGETE